ncbi:O-antigen ligase [Saccharothrix ecbatanensis]|uniref:O-antigen ligase n=1 Tax=Saccharothrix ecbatanensis TaxID=1105145 RepID=A0A7W9HE66_9PSEU|nr:hypothetical protein [Saccharothrix ecbatanensis]MBB5800632.1 O-antigen ligase [Saccharothrix ecbatanensis]
MRALWIGLAVFSVLCGIATGFLAAVAGDWAALPTLAGAAGLVVATVKLRPEDSFRVAAILIGLALPVVSMVSVPAAWLAVTGEPADCVLVEEHAGRYDPKGTPHVYEFDCAGERFSITEKDDTYSTELGDRVELVLDRNRMIGAGLPTAPAQFAIVALLLTGVVGLSFLVALLGLPLRPPPKPRLPDQLGPPTGGLVP